jgi:hypothetical protein
VTHPFRFDPAGHEHGSSTRLHPSPNHFWSLRDRKKHSPFTFVHGASRQVRFQRLSSVHPRFSRSEVDHPSDTTRSPRPGEIDGKHYYFVSPDKFKSLIDERAFIEHAQFSGNFYGTSFMTVKNVTASGRRCLLDIDSQVG